MIGKVASSIKTPTTAGPSQEHGGDFQVYCVHAVPGRVWYALVLKAAWGARSAQGQEREHAEEADLATERGHDEKVLHSPPLGLCQDKGTTPVPVSRRRNALAPRGFFPDLEGSRRFRMR